MQELNSHLNFPTIIATVCWLSVGIELGSPTFNSVFPPLNVAVIGSAIFTVGLFAVSHFLGGISVFVSCLGFKGILT